MNNQGLAAAGNHQTLGTGNSTNKNGANIENATINNNQQAEKEVKKKRRSHRPRGCRGGGSRRARKERREQQFLMQQKLQQQQQQEQQLMMLQQQQQEQTRELMMLPMMNRGETNNMETSFLNVQNPGQSTGNGFNTLTLSTDHYMIPSLQSSSSFSSSASSEENIACGLGVRIADDFKGNASPPQPPPGINFDILPSMPVIEGASADANGSNNAHQNMRALPPLLGTSLRSTSNQYVLPQFDDPSFQNSLSPFELVTTASSSSIETSSISCSSGDEGSAESLSLGAWNNPLAFTRTATAPSSSSTSPTMSFSKHPRHQTNHPQPTQTTFPPRLIEPSRMMHHVTPPPSLSTTTPTASQLEESFSSVLTEIHNTNHPFSTSRQSNNIMLCHRNNENSNINDNHSIIDNKVVGSRIQKQRQMLSGGGSLFLTSPRSFLMGKKKNGTTINNKNNNKFAETSCQVYAY